jgi:predicted DCC family thiol-disulfide oxidoreductase YuxK
MILAPRRRLSQWWNRLWFDPSPPGNLGFCRMLLFGLMFLFYSLQDYTVWGDLPESFRNANPIFLFDILRIGAPSIGSLAAAQFVFRLALLLACVGLFTRTSCLVALISGTYVLGMPNTFGKAGHGDGILVLAMLILALSRCGDAWSIDSIARSWRRGPPFAPPPTSGEYTWPIRCMWLLSALVFFAAGMAKLRLSGFSAWALSDNMAHILLQHKIKSEPPTDWGVWIAQIPWLYKTLAAATIIVEVLFPLALVSKLARRTLVPTMFLGQVLIALTMGVVFTQFMFVYLFWVPWDKLGRALRRFAATRWAHRAIFYDGGCGFCRKSVAVLWHLDVLRRLSLHDIVSEWDAISRRHPQLDRATCFEDMHVVTAPANVYRGFDAYRSIAWALPATWLLLPALYLPPVRWLGSRIYGHVATHRHDGQCELPTNASNTLHAGPAELVQRVSGVTTPRWRGKK